MKFKNRLSSLVLFSIVSLSSNGYGMDSDAFEASSRVYVRPVSTMDNEGYLVPRPLTNVTKNDNDYLDVMSSTNSTTSSDRFLITSQGAQQDDEKHIYSEIDDNNPNEEPYNSLVLQLQQDDEKHVYNKPKKWCCPQLSTGKKWVIGLTIGGLAGIGPSAYFASSLQSVPASPGNSSVLTTGRNFSASPVEWTSTPNFQEKNISEGLRMLKKKYYPDFLDFYFTDDHGLFEDNIPQPYELLGDLSKPGGFSVDRKILYIYLEMDSGRIYKEKASDIFQKGQENFNDVLLREIEITLNRLPALVLCYHADKIPKTDFSKEEIEKYNVALHLFINSNRSQSQCKNIFETLPGKYKNSFLEDPLFLDSYEPIKRYLRYTTRARSGGDEARVQVLFDEMREPADDGKRRVKKRDTAVSKGALSSEDVITVSQIFEYFSKRYLPSIHPTTSNPSPIIGSSIFSAKIIPAVVISHNRREPTHRDMKGENKAHRDTNPPKQPKQLNNVKRGR